MTSSLKIQNLNKQFKRGGLIFGTKITAVENVNIELPAGKPWIMSIVGESGSGKSTLAMMVLRLLDMTSGDIFIDEKPLSCYRHNKTEFYKKVQPIFQNPFSAFSSRRRVDAYLYSTAMKLGGAQNRIKAKAMIEEALESVGLDYQTVEGKYPNQFSGGELQRISIARALITRPSLIVADEPVAMIDASLRTNIVNLFKKIKDEYNVNFIYITHDLSTAYYVSDYIATLYRGNLIEFGNAQEVLNEPAHPYTRLLLDSVPRVGDKWEDDFILPDMETKEYGLAGCKFANRCPYAKEVCRTKRPPSIQKSGSHMILCYKYNDYNEMTFSATEGDIIKKI